MTKHWLYGIIPLQLVWVRKSGENMDESKQNSKKKVVANVSLPKNNYNRFLKTEEELAKIKAKKQKQKEISNADERE